MRVFDLVVIFGLSMVLLTSGCITGGFVSESGEGQADSVSDNSAGTGDEPGFVVHIAPKETQNNGGTGTHASGSETGGTSGGSNSGGSSGSFFGGSSAASSGGGGSSSASAPGTGPDPETPPESEVEGDVNDDNEVNIVDLSIIGQAYGSKLGDLDWNENADLYPVSSEGDGEISIFDLAEVGYNYGRGG